MNANQTVNVVINDAHWGMVKDAVSLTNKAEGKWAEAADALHADGVRHWMIKGKDKVAEVAEKATMTIIAGLPVNARKLLLGDVKAMTDEEKANRRHFNMSYLGSGRDRLCKALQNVDPEYQAQLKAEAEAKAEAEGEAEGSDKASSEKLKIVLETALKIVQGDESPQGYDPVIMAKLIGQALAIIK
jgi:hypothetical protein